MRSTIVKGTDDGIRIDLGGNTDIIGEIIRRIQVRRQE